MLVAVIGAVALILVGEKALGKGLVLGTLFSIVNFVLMAHLMSLNAASSRTRASAAALGSIVFRFALLAIPLILSLRLDSIHLVGVVIGLFMIQMTLLFDQVLRKHLPFARNT
jgi:hypothetical protein